MCLHFFSVIKRTLAGSSMPDLGRKPRRGFDVHIRTFNQSEGSTFTRTYLELAWVDR